MYKCPHCHQLGVSAFGKFWSNPKSAAWCRFCEKPSCETTGQSLAKMMFAGFLGGIAFMVSFVIKSAWPVYVVLLLYLCFEILLLYRVPLEKLDAAVVKRGLKIHLITVLIIGSYIIYITYV